MLIEWKKVPSNTKALSFSMLYCIGLGASLEWLQLIMHQGRSFDVLDLIANIIGALGGLLLFYLISKSK